MSIYTVFAIRKTPRYRRRKAARFMVRLAPSRELVVVIFSFGVLAGFAVSKLIGVI